LFFIAEFQPSARLGGASQVDISMTQGFTGAAVKVLMKLSCFKYLEK
jgi:hypothetical protein